MSTLLATTNPAAAAAINQSSHRAPITGRPMPGVGMTVVYHPRQGEVRRGRDRVPAIVTAVDGANRRLDLVVMHDAADFIDQERVPERVANDRGWSYVDQPAAAAAAPDATQIASLRADLAKLSESLFGEYVAPDESILGSLVEFQVRIEKLEAMMAQAAKPAPVAGVRRRGRAIASS